MRKYVNETSNGLLEKPRPEHVQVSSAMEHQHKKPIAVHELEYRPKSETFVYIDVGLEI